MKIISYAYPVTTFDCNENRAECDRRTSSYTNNVIIIRAAESRTISIASLPVVIFRFFFFFLIKTRFSHARAFRGPEGSLEKKTRMHLCEIKDNAGRLSFPIITTKKKKNEKMKQQPVAAVGAADLQTGNCVNRRTYIYKYRKCLVRSFCRGETTIRVSYNV